jgi:signal transduction histidine kinase
MDVEAPRERSSLLTRVWRRRSLRSKLSFMFLSVALLTLACAGIGFAFRTWSVLRESLRLEALTVAETLGNSSSAIVLFGNRAEANELLATLSSQEHISSAILFDKDGQVIGQYVRPGFDLAVPLSIPSRPEARFEDDRLEVFHPISVDDKLVDTVYLHWGTERLYAMLREQLAIAALLMAGCFILAAILGKVFQRYLQRPIDDLVRTARLVGTSGSESVRANKLADDELEILADSFNSMLDTLERRQRELLHANEELARKHAELSRLNLRLQTSNKELDQFAYVASHDLQEPLRKIQTFADLLNRKASGSLDPSSQEYLTFMVDCANRMRILIDDLLELSRVANRGKQITLVDLDALVRKVVSDLRIKVEESGALVEVVSLGSIEADYNQMYSLFLNLINNALKYRRTDVQPRVTITRHDVDEVTASSLEPQARFTIEDNGIGFEPRYSETIFKPFHRVHGREQYSGTGIGLAVCAKIVERHDGKIWAESVPGKGSSFHVVLPTLQRENDDYEKNAEKSLHIAG